MTGDELRARRLRLGLTQTELAARLQVPQATVSRWETGRIAIEHGEMLDLALETIRRQAADGAP